MKPTNTISTSLRILVLCTIVASIPSHSQSLGSLITTQEERAYLDALRQEFLIRNAEKNFDIDNNSAPPPIPTQQEEEPEIRVTEFYLGAIISRSDGEKTIWLNDNALLENELPSNITLINQNPGFALLIKEQNQQFILKPGQKVNVVTNELLESLSQTETQAQDIAQLNTDQNSLIQPPNEPSEDSVSTILSPQQPPPLGELNIEDPSVIRALQALQEVKDAKNE